MVTDFFGSLLQELGNALGVKNLHPDNKNSCLLRLKSGLFIQIEMDRREPFLILGAQLGVVPPGKYRENLFREALKTNDMPYPLHGVLSYSRKTDHLVIFEKIHTKDLTGEKLAAEITPFAEKAFAWSEALLRGDIPTASQTYSSNGGLFGLMR